MEFFAIVITVGGFDLAANLSHSVSDGVLLAGCSNEDGFFRSDADLLGSAQVFQLNRFKVDTQIFKDHLTAGQNAQVTHDGLATIAVARCLDRTALQDASHFVDDQSRQCFAFDVFGDDQQRFLCIADSLQEWNQRLV